MAAMEDSPNLTHSQRNAGDMFYELCCTPCTRKGFNKEAAKYCPVVCKQYFCVDCVVSHDSLLTGHILVDAKQHSSKRSGRKFKAVPTELCKLHHLEVVNTYCGDCDLVGCSVCFTIYHKSCQEIYYIPEYVQSNYPTNQIKQINKDLTVAIKSMKTLKTKHDRQEDDLDKSKATCKQEIQKYRDDVNHIIDKIEADTLADLDAKYNDAKKTTGDTSQDIKDTCDEMIRFKAEIQSDQSNDSQKFVIAKLGQYMIKQGQALQSKLSHYQTSKLHFNKNNNIMTFLLSILTLGIINNPQDSATSTSTTSSKQQQQATSTPANSSKQQQQATSTPANSSKQQQVTSTPANSSKQQQQAASTPANSSKQQQQAASTPANSSKQQQQATSTPANSSKQQQQATSSQGSSASGDNRNNRNITTQQQVTTTANKQQKQHLYTVIDKSQYNIQQPDHKKTCYIWSSCMLDSGSILLADYGNNRLKLIDGRKYRILSSLVLKARPESVCRSSSTEVALCLDDNTIQFISTCNDKLIPGRSYSMNHYCHGIAVISDKLYVGSDSSLYVYTLQGKHLQTISQDKTGDSIFSNIMDITVSMDGQMLHVADFDKGVVTLCTDGTVVWRFNDSSLSGAWGICIDSYGQVIVCGHLSSNILQLSHDGRCLGKVASSSDGLSCPLTVCYITTNHTLILGQWNNNNITVFTVK